MASQANDGSTRELSQPTASADKSKFDLSAILAEQQDTGGKRRTVDSLREPETERILAQAEAQASSTLRFKSDPSSEIQSLSDVARSLGADEGTLFASSKSEDTKNAWRHTTADVSGSAAATIAGVVVYSLSAVAFRTRALTLPLAMAAGGATEYGVKSGVEHALLDPADRTASWKDVAFGMVDGGAGVFGAWAEKRRSYKVLESLGRNALGNVSTGTAVQAGKDLVQDSAAAAIKLSANRGFVGGAAASSLWSLPRRLDENVDTFKVSPGAALTNVVTGVALDSTVGAVTGGSLSSSFAALGRSSELFNKGIANFRNTENIKWIDVYSVNDLHSNIDQLPKLKTVVDGLVDESHAKGRTALFVVAGDPISGHVNFAFTKEGAVEYRALAEVGKKADATIIGLGNHEYDAAGGRFDVDRFPHIIGPILKDNPNVHLINANLDVSSINGFEPLIKRTHSIPIKGSEQRLGLTAVTTEEGAIGGIVYHDALKSAASAIQEIKGQGINFIQLTTHIGAKEDEELARGLLKMGHSVIMSNGGHSHTVLPTLRFIGSKETLAEKLQFWKPQDWIPNAQAGHSGRWLSVNNLAVKPDGSIDRWLTKGKLMPITDEIADNPAMRASLDAEAQEVKALREIKYGARATENYSLRGTRLGETPLGNLYADATLNGLRARNIDLDLALVHSGGIRADLYAGREITRLDLANIVMNAGKLEGEQQELVRVMMKGSEIQKGLEYGVRDMSAPRGQTLAQKAKALLGMTPQEHAFDPGGNLMQVAGMRYKFNLTRPHGDRVYNLELQGKDGALTPILPDKEYAVATRVHAVDKWHKNGVLGDVSLQEAYEGLNYEMLPISQVDLLADHIRGKVIDPKQFGAVEGRIRNRTPVAGEIPYRLGSYQLGPAAAGIADPHQ